MNTRGKERIGTGNWRGRKCLRTALDFSWSMVIMLELVLTLDDRSEVPFGVADEDWALASALALFFDLKRPSKMLEPPSRGESRDGSQ